jgi:hypothetical protein
MFSCVVCSLVVHSGAFYWGVPLTFGMLHATKAAPYAPCALMLALYLLHSHADAGGRPFVHDTAAAACSMRHAACVAMCYLGYL